MYLSGQVITTSAEVTLNGGLIRELPQNPLNSGLGIILICPEIYTLRVDEFLRQDGTGHQRTEATKRYQVAGGWEESGSTAEARSWVDRVAVSDGGIHLGFSPQTNERQDEGFLPQKNGWLVGGFKYFLFSSLFGEMIQFD